MNKIPRCYKYYKDDRLCDLCHMNDNCTYETDLRHEIEKLGYNCQYREYNDKGWGTYFICKKFKNKISCGPDINCFINLKRREKINRILNE